MQRWLDDVLEALGLSTVAIVAISLGGWTALEYATHRPERVIRLALLCPGGIGRQTMGWMLKAVPLRLFGRWGLRRSARIVTGLDTAQTQSVLEEVVLTFTQFKPRTERLPIFSDAALRRLTMPVLIMVGGRDVMFDSAETARRASRCLPHATVRLLPEVGHAIFGRTADILAFLRG